MACMRRRKLSTGVWSLSSAPRPDKIRVILRRVGTGNITFWSVMRGSKIFRDGRRGLRRTIWKLTRNQKAARRRRFDVLALQLTRRFS